MLKSLYRSEVQKEPKLTAALTKIKKLTDEKASRFVVKKGDMKYEGKELVSFAITPGSATGTVVFDAGAAFGITAASLVDQGLTYTAKEQSNGFFPNDVEIELVDPAALSPLAITVADRVITVSLAHDGTNIISTADDVKAAIIADASAGALLDVTGTGAVPLAALALSGLAGGSSSQSYDKVDIIAISRLRSRRWAIKINPTA